MICIGMNELHDLHIGMNLVDRGVLFSFAASRKAGCDYDGGCGESLATSSDRPAIGKRMGKVFP
jgi:hypothetical protein